MNSSKVPTEFQLYRSKVMLGFTYGVQKMYVYFSLKLSLDVYTVGLGTRLLINCIFFE